MKKTAVLIYNQFCNFEIAPALEMLAMAEKPITVFAKSLAPVRSEEGLTVIPEKSIKELSLDEYDSLLLPGAMDIREAIEDDTILDFIRKFDGMVQSPLLRCFCSKPGYWKTSRLWQESIRRTCSRRDIQPMPCP